MTRAVFDCMVFVQSAGRDTGPAAACFRLVDAGIAELWVSPRVLAEVAEVLSRPRVLRQFRKLTPEKIAQFLADIAAKAKLLDAVPQAFSFPRDPKDEAYINLAIAVDASYLVSRDKDLLDLMRDDLPEGKVFRQQFPKLTILDPVAFLQAVRTEAQGNAP